MVPTSNNMLNILSSKILTNYNARLIHYKKMGLSQRFQNCWDSPKKRWDKVKIPFAAFFFPVL